MNSNAPHDDGRDDGRPLLAGRRQRPAASAGNVPPSEAFDFAKGSSSGSGGAGPSPPPPSDEYRRHRVAAIFFLVLCAVALVFRYDSVATFLFEHEDDVEAKGGGGGGGAGRSWMRPWGTAGKSSPEPSSVPTPARLLERLSAARRDLGELLRADYGKYADAAFNRSAVLGAFSAPSNLSSVRLKRRLKIKVIEAALKGAAGGGGGGSGSGNATDDDNDGRVTFRWITAGHSAAAGHGNMFNQTYTASVQSAASVFFDAVGINFIAMSRAAGGSNSGPEHSMCMEAMYGTDIDILWWDFGMTDGGDTWLHYLWGNRVAIHPTLPIMLNFDQDRDRTPVRDLLVRDGLATFTLDKLQQMRTIFPDSKNNPDVDKMPRGVAYYMCGGHHENDDVCGDHKWDTAKYCPKGARFQVSWHNGWKDHLFIGRLAAAFLLEHLEDAVKELDAEASTPLRRQMEEEKQGEGSVVPSISREYLGHLRSLEDADRAAFARSPVSTQDRDIGNKMSTGFANVGEAVFREFLRRPSFCRPADLPSQARYLGLANGGKKRGVHMGLGHYADFDEGNDFKKLPPPLPDDDSTPSLLTRFEGIGNRQNPCYGISLMNIDFKDAFLVRSVDGWMTDVIPNDAELHYYEGSQDAEKKGIFMICTRWCDWGKCELGHVDLTEVRPRDSGNLTILIDEQTVKGVVKINDRCFAMVNNDGTTLFGPGGKSGRKKGQYEVKYRVTKEKGNLLMSAITIL